MYHDQVLTPIKTLFKFKAINITLGLPFIKVTPDHGPNYNMLGKNKSDPSSIFYAFKFLKKLNEIFPKKSLGQKFLTDKKIIDLIIKNGNTGTDDKILEVGAGTGALTDSIIKKILRILL